MKNLFLFFILISLQLKAQLSLCEDPGSFEVERWYAIPNNESVIIKFENLGEATSCFTITKSDDCPFKYRYLVSADLTEESEEEFETMNHSSIPDFHITHKDLMAKFGKKQLPVGFQVIRQARPRCMIGQTEWIVTKREHFILYREEQFEPESCFSSSTFLEDNSEYPLSGNDFFWIYNDPQPDICIYEELGCDVWLNEMQMSYQGSEWLTYTMNFVNPDTHIWQVSAIIPLLVYNVESIEIENRLVTSFSCNSDLPIYTFHSNVISIVIEN